MLEEALALSRVPLGLRLDGHDLVKLAMMFRCVFQVPKSDRVEMPETAGDPDMSSCPVVHALPGPLLQTANIVSHAITSQFHGFGRLDSSCGDPIRH